ncbi:MAG: hypothetical protein ACREHV_17185 [Rhizomicrobium sp.]
MPGAATDTDLHRVVSAVAVLLLHAGLVMAFLFVHSARMRLPSGMQEIEVSFPVFVSRQPPPLPALRPELISPVTPVVSPPPVDTFAPNVVPTLPGAAAISGVGRALFGCDPMKLDTLSPEARAACLRLPPGKPHEQSVRLGPPPDPDSPFTKEIEERFRQATPIVRSCPLGSYNDTHGLPCFGFDQEAPLLQHR